jgi:hypothetical protein
VDGMATTTFSPRAGFAAEAMRSKGVERAHPRLHCRPCHRCRLPRQVSKWEWGATKGAGQRGEQQSGAGKQRDRQQMENTLQWSCGAENTMCNESLILFPT